MRILGILVVIAVSTQSILAVAAPKSKSTQGSKAKAAAVSTPAPESIVSEPSVDESGNGPLQGGHRFLLSSVVGAPFITDRFALAFGAGGAKIDADDGNGGIRKLSFLGLSPVLEVHKSIGSLFAVTLDVNTLILAATNAETAPYFAESASVYIQPGFLFKILETDNQTLSASGQVVFGKSYFLSPFNAIATAANTGQLTLSGLLIKTSETNYVPGVRYALGISDLIGVIADAAFSFGSSKAGDAASVKTSAFRTGASVSLDLNPTTPLPIGFVLGFSRIFEMTKDSDDQNNIALGIYETTAKNFNLGLEFGISSEKTISTQSGLLTMRRYF